jgi:hypothetical protein
MQPPPAALDRQFQPGVIFRRRSLQALDERAVDLLEMNTAVLHNFDGIGDLDQLPGGGFRVRIRAISVEFHLRAARPFLCSG